MSEKPLDQEKITINLGPVDLGRIDLLVRSGFYANRSDLIRTAVRERLERHGADLADLASREERHLGLRDVTRAELEALRERGERLDLQVLGLLRIASDVDADLAEATIARVGVLGSIQAPPSVKAVLKARSG